MSDHLRRAQDEIPDRETPDPADLVIDAPSRATRDAVLTMIGFDPADFNVDRPGERLCGCGAHHDICPGPEPYEASPYNGDAPFDF